MVTWPWTNMHVTVIAVCRLPWCSASRAFICDSWSLFFIWSTPTMWRTTRSVFTGYECLSAFGIKLRYWRTKFCIAWHHLCPFSWSSQSASSTVSKHQPLGGPHLQAFRSRWPDLSGFWIADMERVARRRCNGAVTANLPATTKDVPLPEIISWYSDLTSLFTPSAVVAVSYLGNFKIHWTELNWPQQRIDYVHEIWQNGANWPFEPYQTLKFRTFKNPRWRTAAILKTVKLL